MRWLPHLAAMTLLVALALLPAASAAHGPASAPAVETTTVILVRHAEKTAPTTDPPLSEAGRARAEALAHALADAGVDAIYTTPYRRTQQTAEPLAERLGITPRVAGVDPSYGEPLARRLREEHAGETVLAISHSNTVPELIAALGIESPPEIADPQYDHLFIVTLRGDAAPELLHLRYGAPTP